MAYNVEVIGMAAYEAESITQVLRAVGYCLVIVAYVASLIHVFMQSSRGKLVRWPIFSTAMVALTLWPLGYLLWIFWWPGSLRQWMFGSDKERIRKRVQKQFRERNPEHPPRLSENES